MEMYCRIVKRGLNSIAYTKCKTNKAILHKVTNINLTCNFIIVSKCKLKTKKPFFAAL